MRSIDEFAAVVISGAGIVHRDSGVVLLVPAVAPSQLAVAQSLVTACMPPEDPTGRRAVRGIAAIVTQADPDEVPAFAAAVNTSRGVVVLVHGGAQALVDADTPVRLCGTDSLAWVERVFDEPLTAVHLSGLMSGSPVEPRPATAGGAPLDLLSGTVPGSAVHLRARCEGPDDVTLPREVVEPARDEIDHSQAPPLDLISSAPAPFVHGVLCSRGHFNDPHVAFCSVCGISMHQVTRKTVARPRPALGVLILDDGSAFSMDADYVLGRDPEQHPAVLAGQARPLVLDDDVNGVSRVHARITLVGWMVCIRDEGSSNGTYVVDGRGTRAVSDGDPSALRNGAVLRVGRRTLTFHSYHSGGE